MVYPQSPAFVLSTQKKVSPFSGIFTISLPGTPGDEELCGGCEDLIAVSQEEEPTLAHYPDHLPNLLMLLMGQMFIEYLLSELGFEVYRGHFKCIGRWELFSRSRQTKASKALACPGRRNREGEEVIGTGPCAWNIQPCPAGSFLLFRSQLHGYLLQDTFPGYTPVRESVRYLKTPAWKYGIMCVRLGLRARDR